MKKIFSITSSFLVVALASTLVANSGFKIKKQNNQVEFPQNQVLNTMDSITVEQMANFLQTKEAHYPLSDEFIERFQQKSGGYIENASKAGLIVNKYLHEPNQKWHFFDSWYYASLEDGTMTPTDLAKSRIYTKLLCPELLLWIYEACEVSPTKVKAAKEVAEKGKINSTNVSTIAKNMRSCVAWSDLAPAILEYINK